MEHLKRIAPTPTAHTVGAIRLIFGRGRECNGATMAILEFPFRNPPKISPKWRDPKDRDEVNGKDKTQIKDKTQKSMTSTTCDRRRRRRDFWHHFRCGERRPKRRRIRRRGRRRRGAASAPPRYAACERRFSLDRRRGRVSSPRPPSDTRPTRRNETPRLGSRRLRG